jgi:hypothetical protein
MPDCLTIAPNELFRKKKRLSSKSKVIQAWRDEIAKSQAEAIQLALSAEKNKPGKQIFFLIESFIEQMELDADKVATEVRELLPNRSKLRSLSVGKSIYPFREEQIVSFNPDYKTLILTGLQAIDLRGRGDNQADAIEDLAKRVHLSFQRLIRQVPSEMSEDDTFVLNALINLIDSRKHEELTPAIRYKIGTVTCTEPFRLRWWENDIDSEFDLSLCPTELASFQAGDWFDATVEYDRKIGRVIQILSVKKHSRTAPKKRYSEEKLKRELQELTKISPEEI